ncbi:MAG: SpoIIE family protein phosphatase [Bryobacteraceae bacterium]
MLERLTNTLLWDKQLSPKLQRVWAVLIVLAPLAMAAGLWLEWRIQSRVPAVIAIDRDEAILIARQFLEQRGVDLMDMRITVDPDDEMAIYRYLARSKTAGEQVLRTAGPWLEIKVQFEDNEGLRTTRVSLDPSGRVTGYRLYFPEDHKFGAPLSDAAAQQKASAAVDEFVAGYKGLEKGKCELVSRKDSRGESQSYSCDLRIAGAAEVIGSVRLNLRGNQITERTLSFDLSDKGESEVKESRTARNIYIPYLAVLFVFMLTRYFKRRAQKEISRQRMFVVTAIIAAFLASQVMLEDEPVQISNADITVPYWVPLLFVVIFGYLAGQAAGLAYAAAEGDLRETRPGHLTSLDAFLSGKVFTRNVGRSVVLGTVLLAWALLLRNGLYILLGSANPGVDGLAGYNYLFSRLPWLSLLITALSIGIMHCLAGLLCPLSILERRVRKRWLAWAIFAVCALTTSAFLMSEPFAGPQAALLAAIRAAAVLAAFLGVDLFASIVVATGFPLFIQFVGLSQVSPQWFEHGVWVASITVLWIAAQTVCAFYGRVVDPAEVRPTYASEIYERQQLESEVAAAKEAQMRLLPVGPPVMEGLQVAASCSAAETVNGDFYDYFPISRTRLGVLIIDGGGMGLATALTIALAKGFLMHKAQEGLSPIETLRSLRATLGKELEGASGEGICFLTVDVTSRTLRYARFGNTPGVLIAGATNPIQEVRYNDPGITMWEGFASLSPEHRLVIYTNGLSRLIGEPDRASTDRWLLKKMGGLQWQPAAEFLESIVQLSRRGRMGKRKLTDDVTVMVCTVEGPAAKSMEQVA